MHTGQIGPGRQLGSPPQPPFKAWGLRFLLIVDQARKFNHLFSVWVGALRAWAWFLLLGHTRTIVEIFCDAKLTGGHWPETIKPSSRAAWA